MCSALCELHQRTRLAARLRTLPYWPGADVLSRGSDSLKASGLSHWQVANPRLLGLTPSAALASLSSEPAMIPIRRKSESRPIASDRKNLGTPQHSDQQSELLGQPATANTLCRRSEMVALSSEVTLAARFPGEAGTNEPDPVFTLIETHEQLELELNNLDEKLDLLESEVEEPRPFPLVAWRRYSAIGGSEIDNAREEFLNQMNFASNIIEAEYKSKKLEERRARQKLARWEQRHGIAPLRTEQNALARRCRQAAEALGRIRPATIAGTAALVEYARKHLVDSGGELDWPINALATAVASLNEISAQ